MLHIYEIQDLGDVGVWMVRFLSQLRAISLAEGRTMGVTVGCMGGFGFWRSTLSTNLILRVSEICIVQLNVNVISQLNVGMRVY